MDYEELVRQVRDSGRTEVRDGVTYVVKPIPDREGEGTLDPRVYEDAKKMIGITYPKDFSHMTSEELTVIRQEVGAQNRDVVPGETECFEAMAESRDGSRFSLMVYRPTGQKEKAPGLIYIHGGGFVAGDIHMCENLCKGLAKINRMTVVSVNYRLAPEVRFPKNLEDCYAAVEWTAANADSLGILRDRIAVMGDSAGGNLAAACARLDCEKHTHYIWKQVLLYPVLNMGKRSTDDFIWKESAYDCREEDIKVQQAVLRDVGIFDDLMVQTYLGREDDVQSAYISPILHDCLEGMPETLLVLGEYDYLRQEGEYYAKKLAKAGTDVTIYYYKGMLHAFVECLGSYPQAEDCMYEMARWLSGRIKNK